MIRIRQYTPADYRMVCKWWKAWEWDCLPESSLPQTGAIASDGKHDICAAWLYRTDSDLALLEWFISNKDALENRKEAITAVIDYLCEQAHRMGVRTVISLAQNQHLLKALERQGFSGKREITFTVARVLNA